MCGMAFLRNSLRGASQGGGRWLVLWLLLVSPPSFAAESPGDSLPSTTTTAPVLTLAQVQGRLKELESATGLDEAERTKLQELYRQIQTRLEEASRLKALAETYRNALRTAPEEANRLREMLRPELPEAPASRPPLPGTNAISQVVETRLQQEQAALTALRARLAETEQQRQQEEERPTAASAQLAEAKTRFAGVQTELSSAPPPAADAVELDRAQRALLEARLALRDQEVKTLELELQSNAPRVELLRLTRDDLTRRATRQEALAKQLEDQLAARRQQEAAEARRGAERLRREAIGKHPLVHSMATNIAAIATRTLDTTRRAELWRGQWNLESARLTRRQDDLSDTRRTLDLKVRDQTLGTLLAEQHRSLPDPVKVGREIEKLVLDTSRLRLQMLQLDRQLKDLANPAAVVDGMLRDLAQPVADEAEAGRLEANQRDLLKTTIELEALLEAQLAWMQNAPSLNAGVAGDIREETGILLRMASWREVWDSWVADFVRRPVLHTLMFAAAVTLLILRPRLRGMFHTIAPRLRSVREDRLLFTSVGTPRACGWRGRSCYGFCPLPRSVRLCWAGPRASPIQCMHSARGGMRSCWRWQRPPCWRGGSSIRAMVCGCSSRTASHPGG